MSRVTTGFMASMVVVLVVLTAGCDRNANTPPSPSEASLVITTAEAEKVFDRYDQVNAAADASLDDTAIREVQTGVLLTETLAAYQIHRKAGTKDTAIHFVRPTFLVPTLADAPAFPRYFAVLSKREGNETDRASIILYFTQTETNSPWKATAAAWVVTEAPQTPSGSSPPAASSPATAAPSPTRDGIPVNPKVLPDLRRDASSAVELSPSADADRAVCEDFAGYLTLSPPNGNAAHPSFTSGPFSSDLVQYFNRLWNPRLNRSYIVRVTGERLPVFRFADGGGFVACTFERRYTVAGVGATGTVQFDEGSDTDVLLGGGGREWRSVEEISSMTALIEVPADGASPATVLSCDCYGPQALSATGVRT